MARHAVAAETRMRAASDNADAARLLLGPAIFRALACACDFGLRGIGRRRNGKQWHQRDEQPANNERR